jgi:hypothetical protein
VADQRDCNGRRPGQITETDLVAGDCNGRLRDQRHFSITLSQLHLLHHLRLLSAFDHFPSLRDDSLLFLMLCSSSPSLRSSTSTLFDIFVPRLSRDDKRSLPGTPCRGGDCSCSDFFASSFFAHHTHTISRLWWMTRKAVCSMEEAVSLSLHPARINLHFRHTTARRIEVAGGREGSLLGAGGGCLSLLGLKAQDLEDGGAWASWTWCPGFAGWVVSV